MDKPSNYQECLRAIGHELDQRKLRAFAVEEDAEAIWVLMLRKTGRKHHVRWHYREKELQRLLSRCRARRGKGAAKHRETDYENVLRRVGLELDERSCQSFLLVEFDGELMVRYAMAPSTHRPHLLAYTNEELSALLAEAVARRDPSRQVVPVKKPRRLECPRRLIASVLSASRRRLSEAGSI